MTEDLEKNFFYQRDDWEHFLLDMVSGGDFSDIGGFMDEVFPDRDDMGFDLLLYKGRSLALRGSVIIAFGRDGHIIFPSSGITVPADRVPVRTLIRDHILYMRAIRDTWVSFMQDIDAIRAATRRAIAGVDAGLHVHFGPQHHVYVLRGPEVVGMDDNMVTMKNIPPLVESVRENLKAGIILPVDAPEGQVPPAACLRRFHFPRDASFIDGYRIEREPFPLVDEIPF